MFLGIPFAGYFLYTGNHGNLYSYYLSGYFLIIILLFSYAISHFWKYKLGKLIILSGLIIFLNTNLKQTFNKLNTDVLSSNEIVLQNQMLAIGWINDDASGQDFNVDVYVPPVVPHSYNYLFTYFGDKRSTNMVKRLYTLYEIDPPHPERLEAWINRQNEIGKVEKTDKFGGIIVERRERK